MFPLLPIVSRFNILFFRWSYANKLQGFIAKFSQIYGTDSLSLSLSLSLCLSLSLSLPPSLSPPLSLSPSLLLPLPLSLSLSINNISRLRTKHFHLRCFFRLVVLSLVRPTGVQLLGYCCSSVSVLVLQLSTHLVSSQC